MSEIDGAIMAATLVEQHTAVEDIAERIEVIDDPIVEDLFDTFVWVARDADPRRSCGYATFGGRANNEA